ncbi:flagellar biosynthetic protein FliR [Microbacteriaceae bacterium 4G12]
MDNELLLASFLAFCRIGSFLFFLPFFSGRAIPTAAKITFGLALSVSVADKINISAVETVPHILAYAGTQIIIGLSLAKIVEFFFSIPKMAGHIMDMDLGISQASLFDFHAAAQTTLIATLLDIFFTIVFIALGGVDYLILTIIKSFQYTETIAAFLSTSFLKSILATLLFAITSAVEIALPIMGSLFIVNFVLIIIAKNAPQINIFMNAYAIKITFGIFMIAASIPMLGYVFKNLTNELLQQYTQLFNFFFTK